MSTLLDEFKAVTEALAARSIEYAVCGGWAMTIHGLPRATIDIDLMILSSDLDTVWQIAKSLGYDVEGRSLHFADVARRISKVDPGAKRVYTLDLLLVTDQIKEVWRTRELVDWEESRTWVVSRQGLILLKQISGREQDLLDIKMLVEVADDDRHVSKRCQAEA